MNLRLAFRLSTYLMVAAGHLALALTPEIPPAHSALLFALLVPAWLSETYSRRLPIWFWNWALSLLLLACLFYGIWFAEFFFKAGIYFVAYLAAARIFRRDTPRDYWTLFVLTLMELCAASILTISISFLLSLLIYLLAATLTLILFNLHGEAGRAESGGQARRFLERPWINSSFLLSTSGLALGLFAATFAIFFFIPRMSRTFFRWSTRTHPLISGFSETVQLGEVGRIKLDPTPVMRVRIKDDTEPREGLLWRGNALDSYDGRAWRDSLGYTAYNAAYGAWAQVKPASPLEEQIEQEIYLEPTESTVLFALERVESFYMPHPLAPITTVIIHQNDYYTLPLSTPLYDRLLYHARSRMPRSNARQLRQAWDQADPAAVREELQPYLYLPKGTERIAALAQEIAGNLPNPYDQVVALEKFLDQNFTYSLEPVAVASANPLEDFLFSTRRGYCEHYATALAIMLRTLGVPTRIVNGFQRGAWNTFENYYLVRQSDAHTWVEVYFPGLGWLPFDPTPVSSITYERTETVWSLLRDRLDALRYRWDRYVVDLTLRDQVHGFRAFQARSFQVSNRLLRLPDRFVPMLQGWFGLNRQVALALLLAVAGALGIYLYRAMKKFRLTGGGRPSLRPEAREALAFYRRMLKALRGLRLKPGEAETALEFASRAAARAEALQKPMHVLTDLYQRARFGEYAFSSLDRAGAEAALKELRKIIARGRAGVGSARSPYRSQRA